MIKSGKLIGFEVHTVEMLIMPICLGIFICVFGIFNLKGYVGSLHKQGFTEKTKKPFGRLLGIGTLLIGLALIGLGICSLVAEQTGNGQVYLVGGAVSLLFLVAGIVISLYAMIRYNRSFL